VIWESESLQRVRLSTWSDIQRLIRRVVKSGSMLQVHMGLLYSLYRDPRNTAWERDAGRNYLEAGDHQAAPIWPRTCQAKTDQDVGWTQANARYE
jgi:hypothetical protein